MCTCDVIFQVSVASQYVGSSITNQNKWLEWGCVQAICPSELCQRAAYATHFTHLLHLLGCSISHTCCCSPFVLFLCCAESLLHHHVSPSFIDVCLVLFCSALSSLLLLLHPVWAACTWGLLCFQLCLSLPLQEWTSRSTFRSVRRRNDRGSTAGTDWRRAEVWFRAKQNGTMFREGLFLFCFLGFLKLRFLW